MSFIDRIKANKTQSDELIRIAYESTDPKYHSYIHLIDQNKRIANQKMDLNAQLQELGCFATDNGTYQRLRFPYMSVDGRIKMMRDEHQKANAKFSFTPQIDWEHNLYIMVFESELVGRTVGTAKINFGGGGADSTNPIENAETSATGRALGQAGYGLLGAGSIASAEEMKTALSEQEQSEQRDSAPTAAPTQNRRAARPAQSTAEPSEQKQAEKPAQAPSEAAGQKQETKAKPEAVQYDPNEVRRLIDIKNKLGITKNEALDTYVAAFGKAKGYTELERYTQLVGQLLKEFNDYMDATVLKEQGAA